jgi:hypothetical protein
MTVANTVEGSQKSCGDSRRADGVEKISCSSGGIKQGPRRKSLNGSEIALDSHLKSRNIILVGVENNRRRNDSEDVHTAASSMIS